jgi:hypothetical protein
MASFPTVQSSVTILHGIPHKNNELNKGIGGNQLHYYLLFAPALYYLSDAMILVPPMLPRWGSLALTDNV